ncbi:uncharacterized protein [Ptychodera flava]|uniref:uncharacterized protein isoform X2 n=1 Tax=Ptychodera flava TaxID=63121 RepID=UPI00396A7D39
MADVIIFYGLPFTGKTAHYEANYASYQRVSAEEMYQNDPTISLRQIILQVVGYLRNGCKVVIDDENWSAVTRASYINSIGSKIPGCSFDCVTFEPSEKIQVYWAREWALAELCITGLPDNHIRIDMCQSDNKFKRWFNDASSMPNRQTLTPPRESEGFTIIKVKTYLQTRVFYKFEVPALFIELEGIAKHGSEKISQVRDTMNRWYKFNPCGRIIIINDGQKDEDSQEESQMKKILLEICEDFNICPVYFCGIEDNSRCGQFAVPPNPGLIAWLQRLHHIQLNHRGNIVLGFKYSTH